MKLSPRQRQIAVLKQRGATNKEIAIVLGIGEESVKTQYQQIRRKCKEEGVDIFAAPTEASKRKAFFESLARVEYYRQRFGENCDNSSRIESEAPVQGQGAEGIGHSQTDHSAACR